MVLDWSRVSSVSSMLMLTSGRLASGIAQPEAGPDAYHHVGGLHDLEELVHLLPLAPGAEAGTV